MSEIISRKDANAQGLRHYYTGVPCKRGHIALRTVSSAMCNVCQYEKQCSEERRAYSREYMRQWHAENADRTRQYYQDNAERYRKQCAHYRAANTEKRRAWSRRLREANPERYAAYGRNYRAMKRAADGQHTADDIQAMYTAQNGCCKVCDASFDTVKYHVDHIVALVNGGSNWPENLQLLCKSCNSSKGAKDFNDWWLGRMLGTQNEAMT